MTKLNSAKYRSLHLAVTLGALLLSPAVQAQDSVEDEEDDASNIIVTATAVRQGGSQDIRHFRSVSLDGSFLPGTSDLTLEGLMGEHDLSLPAARPCKQMFCLVGAAMPAALPGRPGDTYFAGLGFASNLDADKVRGEPVSLIAVADVSGSMSDEPIARVREALHVALGKMRKGDRMGIVLYGSDAWVHLPVTDVSGHRDEIARAIAAIDIDGSTNMEAGLKLGYDQAFKELARAKGKTRLMLFTDENANTGDTSPEGFMGLAIDGSKRGVGLTTIGVGVQFDADLASEVSSVRGGNLFFLDPELPAKQLYDREFYNMVSEVAHDIEITMTPPQGWKIAGVFGVPEGLMRSAPEGAVTVKIGSAFLSSNGGGIYASLTRDAAHQHLPAAALAPDAPLLTATLAYTDARTGASGRDAIAVGQPGASPPATLAKAHLLVDEYLTLKDALALFHEKGDKKGAFQMIDGLARRIAASPLAGLEPERKLVAGLRDRAAYVAGYRGEAPKALKPLALVGRWRVIGQQNMTDISRGDEVEITSDEEFITHRLSGRAKGDEITQEIAVNERQLLFKQEGMRLDFRQKGDRLSLTSEDGLAGISLRRIAEGEGEGADEEG